MNWNEKRQMKNRSNRNPYRLYYTLHAVMLFLQFFHIVHMSLALNTKRRGNCDQVQILGSCMNPHTLNTCNNSIRLPRNSVLCIPLKRIRAQVRVFLDSQSTRNCMLYSHTTRFWYMLDSVRCDLRKSVYDRVLLTVVE